jgi:hypothetical protein
MSVTRIASRAEFDSLVASGKPTCCLFLLKHALSECVPVPVCAAYLP